MPLDPNRIEEVFNGALQQATADERSAFLKTACAGDEALRGRVEALLRAHMEASHFLGRAAIEQVEAAQPLSTHVTTGPDPSPIASEPAVTVAEQHSKAEDNALTFLQPSTKPGSMGRLGHYEVLEMLGQGGFGIVVKAFDETLHRVVAIKILSSQMAATSPARKRFLREACAAAAIRHENVVAIYAVEEQPIPYLVMEYIAGQTLQQKLDQSGPLDVSAVLRFGQQIAAGLAAAHAQGLIHRDIKPSNILLEEGVELRVKITDFGLARAADDASLTQSGVIAGTPMYMSPEQANGEHIDHRADLFSLGSVLYVMCSGRPPFRATTTLAVLKRVTEDTPRPIREIIPEVPEWLCAIIARLHAKKPDERFQSAREVAELLGNCLAELQSRGGVQVAIAPFQQVLVAAIPRRSARVSPPSRWRWLFVGLAASLAAGLLLVPVVIVAVLLLGSSNTGPMTRPVESHLHESGFAEKPPPLAIAPFDKAQAKVHQEAWAKHLGVPVADSNSLGMKLALIPPGQFLMGSPLDEPRRETNEGPQHEVTLTQPFYMSVHDVTVGQFKAFVKASAYQTDAQASGKGAFVAFPNGEWNMDPNANWQNPSFEQGDDHPVVCITHNDARAFCEWLTAKEGNTYALPTEAQWEYACRAGSQTKYFFGDNDQQLVLYAWYSENGQVKTHPVGQKKPNAWGLYDMHGNAWEWTADWYDKDYYNNSPKQDPLGASVGTSRIRRGGGAFDNLGRAAARLEIKPDYRDPYIGFRVVLIGKLKAKATPLALVPFVVLGNKQQPERAFATLNEAVEEATKGDTIEIRGDGPFVTAPVVQLEKRLTIRAGTGYHPVLLPSTETMKWQPFFDTAAPLVLEGLEFRIDGQPFALPEKNHYHYAIRTRQPLFLANCRFVARTGQFATIRTSGSSCSLVNCQFLGVDLHGALDWECSDGGKVQLKNCQQAGNSYWFAFHDDSPELHNVTIQLTDNTVLAGIPLTLLLSTVPGPEEAPIRMEVSRNILQGAWQVFALGAFDEQVSRNVKGKREEVLKKLVRWQGQENLYGTKGDLLQLGEGSPVKSLPDWKQFWSSPEENSRRAPPTFEGGDLLELAATDPQRIEANHFRLKAGSPGKGAGPAGKDLGANADLAGPGAGYERWKQTPEYQEWCKKTDELMPKAVDDAWLKQVAALPAEKRVDAVAAKLKELNPGFDGKFAHQIEDGVVTELRIVTDKVTNISPIQVFNGLRVLDCGGTMTPDFQPKGQLADLTPLEGMNLSGLMELQLECTKVSDKGLAHCKNCKNLTILRLGKTQVSDAGLAHFKDCKNLTQLRLHFTNVSGAGLVHFKDCKNLTILDLSYTPVGDEGLAHFTECKNLTQLFLYGTKVSDAGLVNFKGCKNLTWLSLAGTQVSDEGLPYFKDCKNLRRLDLPDTQVGDAGLAHFKDCQNLMYLNLRKTKVTAAKVEELKKALPECKIEWDDK